MIEKISRFGSLDRDGAILDKLNEIIEVVNIITRFIESQHGDVIKNAAPINRRQRK